MESMWKQMIKEILWWCDSGLFPRGSCVEVLVPNVAMFKGGALGSDWSWGLWAHQWSHPLGDSQLNGLLGGGGNWRRWCLVGGRWSLGSCPSGVYLIYPGPFLSFFPSFLTSWLPWADQLCPPAMMLWLTVGPETMESANHEPKPLKPWAQIHFSSFKLFPSVILSQQWKSDKHRCFAFSCTKSLKCDRHFTLATTPPSGQATFRVPKSHRWTVTWYCTGLF